MKYYITADIHGFYTEFQKVLDEAGYFTNPEPHKLIILGISSTAGRKPWRYSASSSPFWSRTL